MTAPPAPETATLLVCCPDRRGIVAALAQLLYGHGGNILDADQHTDREAGIFFQRIQFDLSELHVDRGALEAAVGEVAERMSMTWKLSSHRALPCRALAPRGSCAGPRKQDRGLRMNQPTLAS